MPGSRQFAEYTGKAAKPGHDDRASSSHYGSDNNDNRDYKRKRRNTRIRRESVLNSGWVLPHAGVAIRPKSKHKHRHERLPYRARHHGHENTSLPSASTPRSPPPSTAALRSQHGPMPQPQPVANQYSQALSAIGVSEGDFTMKPPRVHLQHLTPTPRGDPSAAGSVRFQSGAYPRYSMPEAPSKARSHHQPSHMSRQDRISYDDDQDSYVTQSTRRSYGTRASVSSERTWKEAPSTVHTPAQYKPTNRADSVAPGDSASVRGIPKSPRRYKADLHSAQAPRAQSTRRTAEIDQAQLISKAVQQASGPQSSRSRGSNARAVNVQYQAMAPTRAMSISTIDTAELSDTTGGQPRPNPSSVRPLPSHPLAKAQTSASDEEES